MSDFVKKRQKLGKRKLAPASTTSTQFRARSVVLPEQSIAQEKRDTPVTHRQLTLHELLGQLNHYSASVRHDAAKGMHELLSRHPQLLLPHASEVPHAPPHARMAQAHVLCNGHRS